MADLAAVVKAAEPYCALCHKLINPLLKHPHPMSFQVDHIVPYAMRPDLAYVRSNLQATHRICNLRKGKGTPRPGKPRKLPYRNENL